MKCPACKYEKNWDDKEAEQKEDFIKLNITITKETDFRTQ